MDEIDALRDILNDTGPRDIEWHRFTHEISQGRKFLDDFESYVTRVEAGLADKHGKDQHIIISKLSARITELETAIEEQASVHAATILRVLKEQKGLVR